MRGFTHQAANGAARDGEANMTKAQYIKAVKTLEQMGWVKVMTVSHADKDTAYGTCFRKGGEEFYLNDQTFNRVPA